MLFHSYGLLSLSLRFDAFFDGKQLIRALSGGSKKGSIGSALCQFNGKVNLFLFLKKKQSRHALELLCFIFI